MGAAVEWRCRLSPVRLYKPSSPPTRIHLFRTSSTQHTHTQPRAIQHHHQASSPPTAFKLLLLLLLLLLIFNHRLSHTITTLASQAQQPTHRRNGCHDFHLLHHQLPRCLRPLGLQQGRQGRRRRGQQACQLRPIRLQQGREG